MYLSYGNCFLTLPETDVHRLILQDLQDMKVTLKDSDIRSRSSPFDLWILTKAIAADFR